VKKARRIATSILCAGAILLLPALAQADEEADQLAANADAHAKAGAWGEAARLYTEAYRKAPSTYLACNIAMIEDERLDHPTAAIPYYEKCSGDGVDESVAAWARARLAALKEQPPPAPPPPPPLPPPKPIDQGPNRGKLRTVAIVTGATGGLALATGIITAVLAKSKDNDAQRFCDGNRCFDQRALDLEDESKTISRVSTVTVIAGTMLIATGAVFYFLSKEPLPRSANARPLRFGLAW
jgi:hypothetical protein